MLPASFYLEACAKTQIKTVVTNSDTQITLHFISHFISYSPTVDALWAIKKKFWENDFWVFGEHKVQMITEEISRCWYWQSVAIPPPPTSKKHCAFPKQLHFILIGRKPIQSPNIPEISSESKNPDMNDPGEKRRKLHPREENWRKKNKKSVTGAHQLETNPASWVTDRLWQGVTRLMDPTWRKQHLPLCSHGVLLRPNDS